MTDSKKLWSRSLTGLCSLCLMLSLTACAVPPKPVGPTLPNPALYEEPIPVPQLPEGATNADLAQWPLDLIEALGFANADRASLRAWVQQLKEKN